MGLTSSTAVSMVKTNPGKALEIARQFPLKASEIALALGSGEIAIMPELAELVSGEGLLAMTKQHPEIIDKVVVNNLDMIAKILAQVPEGDKEKKVSEITSSLAEASLIVDKLNQVDILKALTKLFADHPQFAGEIIRTIQEVNELLAGEFSLTEPKAVGETAESEAA